MKQILITGFEPFGDFKINPSEALVNRLHEKLKLIPTLEVDIQILPVEFSRVETWSDSFDFLKYDFIFQFGVASERTRVHLERVALNWMESKVPDNIGVWKRGERILENGAEAYFSELDLQNLSEELNLRFGNCIDVSFSAGGYLCNFVYYKTRIKTKNCLFVHLPSKLKWFGGEADHFETLYSEKIFQIGLEIIQKMIV